MSCDSSLEIFIASNPDARELKRALAVKMTLSGIKQSQIQEILGVTSGFISKWKKQFLAQGIESLRLAYKGSQPYLSDDQRQQLFAWLGDKIQTSAPEMATYIQEQFGVVFKSSQSYYELLSQAHYSWKKTQQRNPKANPERVVQTRDEIKKN
jgi:putative transposase